MNRYSVSQFDLETYVVVDNVANREICVCGDYDEHEDAQERAARIAKCLNKGDTRPHTRE